MADSFWLLLGAFPWYFWIVVPVLIVAKKGVPVLKKWWNGGVK